MASYLSISVTELHVLRKIPDILGSKYYEYPPYIILFRSSMYFYYFPLFGMSFSERGTKIYNDCF